MAQTQAALKRFRVTGLTLVELMLVVLLVGVLAGIAMPMYSNYRERINRSTAIMDIKVLQLLITDYAANGGSFPASLADIGNGGKLDPWGHAYQYLDLTPPARAVMRARTTSSTRSTLTLICTAWVRMAYPRPN